MNKRERRQLIDHEARLAFQKNVKRLLEERGVSALWLSNRTGDNRSTVYPALNGTRDVGVGLLVRIAAALRVSVDDLIPVKSITAKVGRMSRRKHEAISG